ncbi:MAG: chemotaxis protein CheW [Chlorobi bacterium]|nr:chemotaxis protein CheW [Chlorobiota bacterium]
MADKQLTSILSFFISEEIFAFDTDTVRNILEPGKITPVPNTKEYFMGVINLHGNIIPVVDLRKIMGIENAQINKDTVIIVVSNDGRAESLIGFIVDGVKEVISLNEDYALQETIIDINEKSSFKITFKGTLRLKDSFIHIINLNDIVGEIEK